MPDDDVIRSVRWKPDVYALLDEMANEMDRSESWVANKALRRLSEDRKRALNGYPQVLDPTIGVSTYRMTFEFQLPAMEWSDNQADDLFFEFLAKLSAVAPDNGGAYGNIDAVRPMQYDERFHHVRLPGQWKYHLDKSQMTPEQIEEAVREAPEHFLGGAHAEVAPNVVGLGKEPGTLAEKP